MQVAKLVQLVIASVTASLIFGHAMSAEVAASAKEQIKRGEYLVNFGGCSDCHTPKLMSNKGPQPDPARLLSGHPANAQIPPPPPAGFIGPNPDQWATITNNEFTVWVGPWGTSYAANLTPDLATGLGGWTADQFVKTMRTGKHLGVGRPLLPPMPWFDIAVLNDQDLKAMFAYLKSIKPIQNQVPAPVPPK
ncbi:MAG TPA: diheme cytochrome c-553 [Casimicrobiaceae bacterium]|nr:diheme cytochrome c-553 [Casimicrobiaceae bacterium]